MTDSPRSFFSCNSVIKMLLMATFNTCEHISLSIMGGHMAAIITNGINVITRRYATDLKKPFDVVNDFHAAKITNINS